MRTLPEGTQKAEIRKIDAKTERPDTLKGVTIKVTPSGKYSDSIYIIMNYHLQPWPVEFFFNTKNAELQPHLSVLSRMLSAVAQTENPSYLLKKFLDIQSPDPYFLKGKLYKSIYSHIGEAMLIHMDEEIPQAPEFCEDCE